MKRFLISLLLPLFFLTTGCEEKTVVVEAKTVQLMRAVCDPSYIPATKLISSKETIIVEEVYKIGKEGELYHVNGTVYTLPEGYTCRYSLMPGRLACVTKDGLDLIYKGACKFEDD